MGNSPLCRKKKFKNYVIRHGGPIRQERGSLSLLCLSSLSSTMKASPRVLHDRGKGTSAKALLPPPLPFSPLHDLSLLLLCSFSLLDRFPFSLLTMSTVSCDRAAPIFQPSHAPSRRIQEVSKRLGRLIDNFFFFSFCVLNESRGEDIY